MHNRNSGEKQWRRSKILVRPANFFFFLKNIFFVYETKTHFFATSPLFLFIYNRIIYIRIIIVCLTA